MFCETLLIDTSLLNDELLFDSCYKKVSQERKNKIDSLYFREDKNNSLAVYILAEKLLKRHEILIDHLCFENGKPFIQDSSYFISFSHSGHYALVCLSDNKTACDIQKYDEKALRIAERFYTVKEKTEIENTIDQQAKFFEIWTKKECLIKATGNRDIRKTGIDDIEKEYVYHYRTKENYAISVYCHKDCVYTEEELNFLQ